MYPLNHYHQWFTVSQDNESRTTIATAEPVRIEKSKEDESKAEAEPKKKTRSSRRSQKVANRGLYVSPGLRFITRKDLYTFLTSAGVSCICSPCSVFVIYWDQYQLQ